MRAKKLPESLSLGFSTRPRKTKYDKNLTAEQQDRARVEQFSGIAVPPDKSIHLPDSLMERPFDGPCEVRKAS